MGFPGSSPSSFSKLNLCVAVWRVLLLPPPLVAGQSSLAYQLREGLEIMGIAVSSPGTRRYLLAGWEECRELRPGLWQPRNTHPGAGSGAAARRGEGKLIFNWKLYKSVWSSSLLSCSHQVYVWVDERMSTVKYSAYILTECVIACVWGGGEWDGTTVHAGCFVWVFELLCCNDQFPITFIYFFSVGLILVCALLLGCPSPSHSPFPS